MLLQQHGEMWALFPQMRQQCHWMDVWMSSSCPVDAQLEILGSCSMRRHCVCSCSYGVGESAPPGSLGPPFPQDSCKRARAAKETPEDVLMICPSSARLHNIARASLLPGDASAKKRCVCLYIMDLLLYSQWHGIHICLSLIHI